MKRRHLNILMRLFLIVAVLLVGVYAAQGQATMAPNKKTQTPTVTSLPTTVQQSLGRSATTVNPSLVPPKGQMRGVTSAMRKAAAQRAKARKAAGHFTIGPVAKTSTTTTAISGTKVLAQPDGASLLVPGPCGSTMVCETPNADYFGTVPNYANSPIIKKFVDPLIGLDPANPGVAGQYIRIAKKIQVSDGNGGLTDPFPGSDYYEIGLKDSSHVFTSGMLDSTTSTYQQIDTRTRSYYDKNPIADGAPSYLGPIIIAKKGRPVRIKFFNELPIGPAGNLFLPTDPTMMGAGEGPNGGVFTENRATLHLHGGANPWISDGTAHQWITPAGEDTQYKKGASQQNVPDMPAPEEGTSTFFWSNDQSARMLWYHDHSYGITRLNVYAGEVAGYILTDDVEEDLITRGIIPGADMGPYYRYGIPLILQDKTFVPDSTNLANEDPTWDSVKWGGFGQLWMPHVYMTNQNPADEMGVNNMGRWDYGPWFWPPMDPATLKGKPVPIGVDSITGDIVYAPGIPNPTATPEAFHDTAMVNGVAYPKLNLEPKAYRFRILNGSNDRNLNLSLFQADSTGTEVPMVDAVAHTGFPATWPKDGRDGGVPDFAASGPSFIQIGNESGFLPTPVEIKPQPVSFNYNRRDIVVLNVADKALFLGPAERADVVVDFTPFANKTLILYNDAPAPVPAFDPRYDYYTGAPDLTDQGGAPLQGDYLGQPTSTLPGFGPNTRTFMQINVAETATTPSTFSLDTLMGEFTHSTTQPSVFERGQNIPVVQEAAFNTALGTTWTNHYARIQSTQIAGVNSTPTTLPLTRKAIQELFELDYGRMNATLGIEMPFTNFNTQTTIPLAFTDPATEVIRDGVPQIWKITHNGVDTHPVHFHLFDVQLLNRVGWDGAVRPPDPNEVGWKDTVRMNPLEDAIVALLPKKQGNLPFPLPDSYRSFDVTMPPSNVFNVIDSTNTAFNAINQVVNYGWEYTWHCHILAHEENDFMRPVVFQVYPEVPANLAVAPAVVAGAPVAQVTFKDASLSEAGFTLQRSLDPTFATGVTNVAVAGQPQSAQTFNTTMTYNDNDLTAVGTYYYRVRSYKDVYHSYMAPANGGLTNDRLNSDWSASASIVVVPVANVTPASLSFGTLGVGVTSTTRQVTIQNTGLATMTIGTISIGGTDAASFQQTNTCTGSLISGNSCVVSVKFVPAVMGNLTASLTFTTNDPANANVAVPLTGTGAAISFSPSSLSFSNQYLLTNSAARIVTVVNNGNAAVAISSIAITGTNADNFSQTSTCGTSLAAKASCAISVIFRPTTAGAKTASLVITDADPTSPQTVALDGTGVAVQVSTTPNPVAFNSVLVGTSSTSLGVTFANNGTLPLTISGMPANGFIAGTRFTVTSSSCNIATLAVGATCRVFVSFQPTALGAQQVTISPVFSGATVPVTFTGTGAQGAAITSPANGSIVTNNQPINVTWGGASAGVTSYTLRIGSTPGGNQYGTVTNLTGTSVARLFTAANTTYYLQLYTYYGTQAFVSPVVSFTTNGQTPTPTILTPAPGATGVTSPVVVTWTPVPTATQYAVRFGSTPGANDMGTSTTTGTTVSRSLPPGRTYYVTFITYFPNGQASTSQSTSFTTQ